MALLVQNVPLRVYLAAAQGNATSELKKFQTECAHQKSRKVFVAACRCERLTQYCDVFLKLLITCDCKPQCVHFLPIIQRD